MILLIILLTCWQVRKILSWETLFLTYIIIFSDGELYTATVSDFSGSDPLIYKEPLRTEQYDSKILNSKLDKITSFLETKFWTKLFSVPDFVKMLEDEDYVYFFLREQAVEYINCGKVRIISLSYHKLRGKENHICQNN